ncbi:unnamed protein product [Adineta steineri]|uniref:Cytidyltransferase-like domain-containing protein n=1 Tax=Adineta steineri TaxID=433720 RepID=A0A819SMQ2_9BILA|nr:unnamed protein product [Adineta steineri]CAF4058900.1 unnamed protein product [Adineta steineri]
MPSSTKENHFNFSWLFLLTQIISLVSFINHAIESIMFLMIEWYDLYMYTPLQVHLSPYVARIPRFIRINNKSVTVFNANIVTYSRTLLIIPIAWCLKYNYSLLGCLLVLLHDFLDHVDGIVAKVHKRIYGEHIDDPLLGGFMDAFCDKIVNIFCLWTILQETHFEKTSFFMSIGFVFLCYTIIGLETAIGIVRVQDYFCAAYGKHKMSSQGSTSAAMEGKLKEKLESMGLAFLCLSTGHIMPFRHWSGTFGIICFTLTIRLAYASLMKKLQARRQQEETDTIPTPFNSETDPTSLSHIRKTFGVINAPNLYTKEKSRNRAKSLGVLTRKEEKREHLTIPGFSSLSTEDTSNTVSNRASPTLSTHIPNLPNNHLAEINKDKSENRSTISTKSEEEQSCTIHRSSSLPTIWINGRADKVYTIGCFDLFHEGHRLLLQGMRQYGREVIVGVHDSRSIYKLKSRVPVDGTKTRMLNVRRYADQVFCVAETDPSSFITCILHLRENETALYIRGDDMINFPSRHIVENIMPVKFLPYTNGVSSTTLRQELFSHIIADDMGHLEKVN